MDECVYTQCMIGLPKEICIYIHVWYHELEHVVSIMKLSTDKCIYAVFMYHGHVEWEMKTHWYWYVCTVYHGRVHVFDTQAEQF